LGEETNGNYLIYHYDLRGSTVALTDMDGEVVEQFDYSPFGELLTQPIHNAPFSFNGYYGVMTDANDLYYMRARFYSPDLRRFINQDILLGGIENEESLSR